MITLTHSVFAFFIRYANRWLIQSNTESLSFFAVSELIAMIANNSACNFLKFILYSPQLKFITKTKCYWEQDLNTNFAGGNIVGFKIRYRACILFAARA